MKTGHAKMIRKAAEKLPVTARWITIGMGKNDSLARATKLFQSLVHSLLLSVVDDYANKQSAPPQ